MSTPRWQTIKELVDAALDLEPEARPAYLDRFCSDAAIRAEVESLLAHETPGFMDQPAAAEFAPELGEASAGEPPVDLTGALISRYRIEERIGRGGMGEVYLAQDQELDRRVAVKVLGGERDQDEMALTRFLREARSAAALDHPYICKIYEIGDVEERPFIAMEYVEGETLTERIESSPMPLGEALEVAAEIAEALDAAHCARIVHRDLKPANIMITIGGHVKVLDFGLAKRVESGESGPTGVETASRHTGTGVALGTLAYMAPEQLRGEAVDARADVFAFGIVLFEMLTGEHPFDRGSAMESAAAILHEQAPTPSQLRPDLPPQLDALVARMLAKDADSRLAEGGAVGAALAIAAPGRVPAEREDKGGAPFGVPIPTSFLGRVTVAVVLTALLLVAVQGLRSVMLAADPRPSVAMLQWSNVGGDPDDDLLVIGMPIYVGERLRRAGLRVASLSATSPLAGDGRSAAALAREIGVDAIVTAGLSISDDDEITANVRLTLADGAVVWRDAITVIWEDMFDLQSHVAVAVGGAMKGTLSAADRAALELPESADLGAYEQLLRGIRLFSFGTVDGAEAAAEWFADSAENDPELADASAGIGLSHAALYAYGAVGRDELARAETHTRDALAVDPSNTQALRALATLNYYRGRSVDNIELALAGPLAESLDAGALLWRAQAFGSGGLPGVAVPILERIVSVEPTNETAFRFLALGRAWSGDLEGAIEAGEAYLGRFGDELEVRTWLAITSEALGELDAARVHFAEAVDLAQEGGAAGGAAATALLFGGMFAERHDGGGRSRQLWTDALRSIRRVRAAQSGDNPGVLVNEEIFERLRNIEPEDDIGFNPTNGFVPPEVATLAATYAFRGERGRAANLLTESFLLGSLNPSWKLLVSVADPGALESPEFAEFVELYDSRLDELREAVDAGSLR